MKRLKSWLRGLFAGRPTGKILAATAAFLWLANVSVVADDTAATTNADLSKLADMDISQLMQVKVSILGPSEYQLKAAFLYNFGKFISWPDSDFDRPDAPLVIGVFGGNPFHDDLKNRIAGKSINGYPVVFRLVAAQAGAKNCHILFVNASAQNEAANILGAPHGANVLTVTENMTHFAQSGYAIDFVVQQDKIYFQINGAAAAQAGLTISSKLMSLAKPLGK